MMKITECLNTEHGVFLTQLAFLETLLEKNVSKAVLSAVVSTISRAVDNHKEMEEKFLYPAIEEACGPNFPPLRVMEQEHQTIEQAVETIKNGPFNAATVRTFIDTLRGHISKEIQVLFPMAEAKIPSEKLEKMTCCCVEHVHQKSGVPR